MALLPLLLLLAATAIPAHAQNTPCAQLHSLIATTYNFKPSTLTAGQRREQSSAMDEVWKRVKADPSTLSPCLIAELESPSAGPWFLFDGAALLATLDRAPRASRIVLRSCEAVDLDDVALEDWLRRLTTLALDDMDISVAAGRWLRYPHATYTLPQHAFTVKRPEGALFLYGSMEESLAARARAAIAAGASHPERELALSLLANLATPSADDAFRSIDLTGLPDGIQKSARSALAARPRFEPRHPPKSTRAQFLSAFQVAVGQRDFRPFMELMEKVPDGERDVVTVMTAEDLPLIRKARRAMAASGNPHLMEVYPYMTGIICTLQAPRR
jgi:hypothetical protein